MGKNVLILASNTGLWAEELQAPWDLLKKAGHKVTLGTNTGKTPLPLAFSMDPDFIDPVQKIKVNTQEVVTRTKQILEAGEWSRPIKIDDAKMADYDALVVVGGPGSPLDISGNPAVHRLLEEAYRTDKIIGTLCYAVGALVWALNPDNERPNIEPRIGETGPRGLHSIICGKTIVAHPRDWDYVGPMGYTLFGATPDNPSPDVVTPGFLWPLAVLVQGAVGPNGKVLSDPKTSRDKPQVHFDYPFVTALSVESSFGFGNKLVEVLATEPSFGRKFYRKHMTYFDKQDVDGLVKNDYTEDAILTAPEFSVQGRDALKAVLTDYLSMVGTVRVKTTERFLESGNIIFIEATCQTSKAGERRVYDIWEMRDGKIARHFTGLKG